jgi:hypothetical protein
MFFFFFFVLGTLSKLFWGGETQVFDGKFCENDEFGVRMDLGRSQFHTFRSLKKNNRTKIFFLAISIQKGAKI